MKPAPIMKRRKAIERRREGKISSCRLIILTQLPSDQDRKKIMKKTIITLQEKKANPVNHILMENARIFKKKEVFLRSLPSYLSRSASSVSLLICSYTFLTACRELSLTSVKLSLISCPTAFVRLFLHSKALEVRIRPRYVRLETESVTTKVSRSWA